jgi:4-amino-4-deoxy-L-arabinose transferase-like glycosyltransferase
MYRTWLPRLLALLLILYFWEVGLDDLDRFPPIQEDEPWIAAPGYTFWEKGYFGTDLFAGFFGMEEHYYTYPPLFSLMVGAGLHLFGMGLFQARIIPLICMTLTLALTYGLGAVLFSSWHGVIAVGVLVGWRVAQPVSLLISGIPLVDLARIARYDVAVPVFGLGALLALIAALRKPSWRRFFAVGVLIGLATLSHYYGGFWLIGSALLILLRFRQRAIKAISISVLGFGLTLAPWLLFIASGWSDFLNQFRQFAGRLDLLNPHFYVMSLSDEWQRYQPILDAMNETWGARLWLALLIIGLVWLAVQGVRRRSRSSQMLLFMLGSIVGMFALIVSFKTFSYLSALWVLFALVIAAGLRGLWRISSRRGWKLILTLVYCVAMVEGGVRIQSIQAQAAETTPYRTFTDAIAAKLPPNSRVMGLQHYWFGLAERTSDYRSILVPMNLTNPTYVANPILFAQAVDAIRPDVILIDQLMLNFLDDTLSPDSGLHALGDQIRDYLGNSRLIGEVYDSTYGLFRIYQLDSSSELNRSN